MKLWVINGYDKADVKRTSKSWEYCSPNAITIVDVATAFAKKHPLVVVTNVLERGEYEEL